MNIILNTFSSSNNHMVETEEWLECSYNQWYDSFPYSSNATTFESVSGAINPDVFPWFGNYVLYILGSVHLFLSLWMFAEYIAINWRNFTTKLPDLFNLIIERYV